MGIVALATFGGGAFDDPEKMMPALALRIFPAWLAGILICGALAAMMSTADSQLLVTTSAVAEDVYHQSLRPEATQKHLVRVSRWTTVVLGIAAIALSQLPRSIFDKVLFAWGGLGAAFGPALVLSLWWSRTTRGGVLAGMIVGFLTIILWDNSPWRGELYSLVPGFVTALLAVVIVSRLTGRGTPGSSDGSVSRVAPSKSSH
jgi:sodium/proline symporter